MKLTWPWSKSRKSRGRRHARVVRAKYDAAQTTVENIRHWAMADGLSADSANSVDARRKLRQRARYEVANNSYAKGIVLTIANDTVGTGPRLQMLTGDSEVNRRVELAFAQWAAAVGLAQKLRTMRMAKATDGEVFAALAANPLVESPVELAVQLIEADRVASPTMAVLPVAGDVDGIRLDRWGNPAAYAVMRYHPGEIGAWRNDYDLLGAAAVIHYFRADRPGQHRGVPEITPALPLFAQLRRYTLAVLGAAETAADFAAVLYTDSPANGESAAVEPMDIIELEKRMATTLPDGWKLGQIKAEQPGTTYAEFKQELLNEIARCLNMPYNIAACNSSGYNYASGRLDHQTYYKSIRVEQAHMGDVVLDRIFAAWLYEAELVGLIPSRQVLCSLGGAQHQWFFDGTEHVDPAKEAKAQAARLGSHTTTLAIEYARQGRDWETELRQRAKEKQLMDELGLSAEQAVAQPQDTDTQEDEHNDDEDDS